MSPGTAAQQAAPASLVPVSIAMLRRTPDAYEGRPVSLLGYVGQEYSQTAFSIGSGKGSEDSRVLVLVPRGLSRPLSPNVPLSIVGQVTRFTSPDAAGLPPVVRGLSPDLVARYARTPVVVATAVLDGGLVDLVTPVAKTSGDPAVAAASTP